MKSINKRVIIATAVLVVVALGYFWHTSREDRLPSGHFRVEHHIGGHLDILLPHRAEISYNFYGHGVRLYIAHYQRDELVLHELVGSISLVADTPQEISGTMYWAITTGDTMPFFPRELHARIWIQPGAVGFGHFDFSQLDFQPTSSSGPPIVTGRIEPGRRYLLQLWPSQVTAARWWVDSEAAFDPELLRMNEHTTILYIVFE